MFLMKTVRLGRPSSWSRPPRHPLHDSLHGCDCGVTADGLCDLISQALPLPDAPALPLGPELTLQQSRVETPVETRVRVEAVQRRRPAQSQEQDLLVYTRVKEKTLREDGHGCSGSTPSLKISSVVCANKIRQSQKDSSCALFCRL